jgi:hypothetical protein
LVGEPEEKDRSKDLGVDVRIILKWNKGKRASTGFIWHGIRVIGEFL